MSFFDQIYFKIFGKGSSDKPPIVVDEIIKRNSAFAFKYEEWKKSPDCEGFLSDVNKSFNLSKQGMYNDPEVIIHEGINSNGFAISYPERLDKSSFHFFFDYLADQVKKLNYKLNISKQTLKENGEYVEKKEMHYLKPKNNFVTPIDQKYGNVQIEYIELNNEPRRIKFIVNSYPDSNYTKALSFHSLVKNIFEPES
ncbi:MAG: hypothetical protein AAF600_11670 [Bacteroidota bacterium]